MTKFVSEPIADGAQIDGITDAADLSEVLTHLLGDSADINGKTHALVTLIWNRGEDLATAGAMREIDINTADISNTPVAPRLAWTLRREDSRSEHSLHEFSGFSTATNFATKRIGVARFGKRDTVGDGFPHGFEVQIRGPKSTRQVLLHSNIVGNHRKGTKAHSDLRAIVLIRDM